MDSYLTRSRIFWSFAFFTAVFLLTLAIMAKP